MVTVWMREVQSKRMQPSGKFNSFGVKKKTPGRVVSTNISAFGKF